MNTYTRKIHDSRVVGISFTNARWYPDFADSPIISATLTQSPAATLTLGTPDVVTTENVVAFRISGGVVGEVEVKITAVNAAGDTKCESLLVITEDC